MLFCLQRQNAHICMPLTVSANGYKVVKLCKNTGFEAGTAECVAQILYFLAVLP